jgi:hypothetical protein
MRGSVRAQQATLSPIAVAEVWRTGRRGSGSARSVRGTYEMVRTGRKMSATAGYIRLAFDPSLEVDRRPSWTDALTAED